MDSHMLRCNMCRYLNIPNLKCIQPLCSRRKDCLNIHVHSSIRDDVSLLCILRLNHKHKDLCTRYLYKLEIMDSQNLLCSQQES